MHPRIHSIKRQISRKTEFSGRNKRVEICFAERYHICRIFQDRNSKLQYLIQNGKKSLGGFYYLLW